MATNVLTPSFNVKNAQRFLQDIQTDITGHYFVTFGNINPWEDDNNPPSPNSSVSSMYSTFDNLIAGKKVEPQDATLMIPYIPWTANTVYDAYSDQANSTNFYVVSQEGVDYNVFLCLNNNGGAESVGQPLLSETSDHDEYYVKQVDGYQWKFLFTITGDNFTKFATSQYVPCIPNSNVALNAVNGAIESVSLTSNGTSYNSYANGFFANVAVGGNTLIHNLAGILNPTMNFYVNNSIYITSGTGAGQLRNITLYNTASNTRTIVLDQPFTVSPDLTSTFEIEPQVLIIGDGTGAQARALVNTLSNTVFSVQMISHGTNYSYANVTINGLASSNATAQAVISPFGGHGFDVPTELGAGFVGVSVTFANTENNTIPATNNYRQFGLLEDPKFSNVSLTYTNYTNANTLDTIFYIGETVTGLTSNASGIVTTSLNGGISLTDVSRLFVHGETLIGGTSNSHATTNTVTGPQYTVDARTRLAITGLTGSFQTNEVISQANAFGTVHAANSSFVGLTNVKGNFQVGQKITGSSSGVTANVASVTPSDIVNYQGEFLYIENIQPVTRNSAQSETIRLVFSL